MQSQENVINESEPTKKCSKCGEIKLLSEFYKCKKHKGGYQYRCKICDGKAFNKFKSNNPIYMSDYYQNNKERLNHLVKTNRHAYKVKTILYYREYHKKNISRIRQYQNEWVKNKYITNINYKIKTNFRSRLLSELKNNTSSKKYSSNHYLGCSIEFYRQYLENQFLPEMTWENHGKIWEIDHIIPCSSFDLSILEEQQKCFHYSNMQPLFKTTEIAELFGYTGYIGNRNKLNKLIY